MTVGASVGGVLGGLLFIAALVALAFCVMRRRRAAEITRVSSRRLTLRPSASRKGLHPKITDHVNKVATRAFAPFARAAAGSAGFTNTELQPRKQSAETDSSMLSLANPLFHTLLSRVLAHPHPSAAAPVAAAPTPAPTPVAPAAPTSFAAAPAATPRPASAQKPWTDRDSGRISDEEYDRVSNPARHRSHAWSAVSAAVSLRRPSVRFAEPLEDAGDVDGPPTPPRVIHQHAGVMSAEAGRRAQAPPRENFAAHHHADGSVTPPHVIDSHLGEQVPARSRGAQPAFPRDLVQQGGAFAGSPFDVGRAAPPATTLGVVPSGANALGQPPGTPDQSNFQAAISAVESRHALALAASDARASAAHVAATAAAREIAEARREASAARQDADAARSHASTASSRAEAALQEIRAARLIAVEKEAEEVNARAEKLAAERAREATERAAREAERAKEVADLAAIMAAAASAAAAHRDAPSLPPGWSARTSRRTGAVYYVHDSGAHSVDHPSMVTPAVFGSGSAAESTEEYHYDAGDNGDEQHRAFADGAGAHADASPHTDADSERGGHDGGFESDNTEDLLHRAANILNSHEEETRTVRFHLPVASAPRRDADGSVWVEKMSSKGRHFWVNVTTGESRW